MPKMHRPFAKTLHDRFVENLVQIAAMDREMRIFIPRIQPAGFGEDQLAMTVEIGEFPGFHPMRPKRIPEIERIQHADRVGHHIDAEPERLKFRRCFIDPAGNAPGVKRQRHRQTADAAPARGTLLR